MNFVVDFRESNPKLHKLYVAYALETLRTSREAMDMLDEHSRIDSLLIASTIGEILRDNILTEAAYFEAAALLFANADISEYEMLLYS